MPFGKTFISYSTKDSIFAKKIAQSIKEWGYSYWIAPDMIPAGSSYAKEIPQAIEMADVFILLLSKNSMESIWVEKELDHALSNRKKVLPVLLDQTPLNGTFQFYLNNVQFIPYQREVALQLRDLKRELDSVFAPSVASAPVMGGDKKIVPGSRGNKSTNSLRINHIPITCEKCGCAILKNIKVGTYECDSCGHLNYDDFQTIRNYLAKVGNAPAAIIERDTGVSRNTINVLFQEEFLEIPASSDIRVACSNCGAPIRSGMLCQACKTKGLQDTIGPTDKNRWHTYLRKN